MVVHLIQSLTIPTHHFVFSATSKGRQVGHLWILLLNVTFTIPIMVLIFVILTLFDFLKIFWIFLEIFDEILFEFFFCHFDLYSDKWRNLNEKIVLLWKTVLSSRNKKVSCCDYIPFRFNTKIHKCSLSCFRPIFKTKIIIRFQVNDRVEWKLMVSTLNEPWSNNISFCHPWPLIIV